MAKLTGQFTTPRFDASNNKTHEAFLHAVVFVFTSGTTKITRETDAKGKYSFDLANGEYEVSVYLKGNTEKDRFDMRAGEKFVVTATTKADALEKWLQVIGAGGKDELAAYYENLLSQMQKVFDDFKKETEFVGDMKEPIMRRGYSGLGSVSTVYGDMSANPTGHQENRFFTSSKNIGMLAAYHPAIQLASGTNFGRLSIYNGVWASRGGRVIVQGGSAIEGGAVWESELWLKSQTTVDSNGNVKSASPIIRLFKDRFEYNNSFKTKPIFQKLGVGIYKISNTQGLAKEGWTHNIPLNGNGRGYFRVRVEHLEDGCIVRVFKIKNVLNPDTFEIDVVDGDPIDIGKDQRWIDLRFHEEPQEADDEELLAQLDNLDESAH